MPELVAAIGGFVAAQIAFTLVIRWIGVLYVEVVSQPREVRRPQVILPILLLHSGPWVIALLIFGAVKLFQSPAIDWRPWLVGGFAAGSALMLGVTAIAVRKFRRSAPLTR